MIINIYTDMPVFSDEGATACSDADPDIFFPIDARHGFIYKDEQTAKSLCKKCPYMERCLLYAMKNPDVQGIWGGTNEKDRKRLSRFNRYK